MGKRTDKNYSEMNEIEKLNFSGSNSILYAKKRRCSIDGCESKGLDSFTKWKNGEIVGVVVLCKEHHPKKK